MILAQTLPITILLIVGEVVAGGMLALVVVDFGGAVTRGFLLTTGLIFLVGAILADIIDRALDATSGGGPAFIALMGLVATYCALVFLKQRLMARAAGIGAILSGAATLHAAAMLQPQLGGMQGNVSLLLATIVLGAAMTAMLLGHWYLVTPLLSAQPLRRVTEILVLGLFLQVLLSLSQFVPLLSSDQVAQNVSVLLDHYGFVFWFRIIIGVLFPLALAVLTWQSCRLRAMQTATGLLYIAVTCALAGEAASRVLLYLTKIAL